MAATFRTLIRSFKGPTSPEVEHLRNELARRQPSAWEAISEDARVFNARRGDDLPMSTRSQRLAVALRLLWVSDAFLALAAYRVRAHLQVRRVPVIPRLCHRISMSTAQVSVGDSVLVAAGLYLPHGQVVIDGLVSIGPRVSIAPWTTLGLVAGGIVGPTVGAGVSIGTGAKILGPVVVGDAAVVGANAVVISDVAAQSTVVGVPAKPVHRSD